MKTLSNRIVSYPKAIANTTGMRRITGRKLLTRMRCQAGKNKGTLITAYKFCNRTVFRPE